MREVIDPVLTAVETPIIYLSGHDQGEPQLATPGSAGYDLPAILTRSCLSNDNKPFLCWKGKRQWGEKRVEANKPPIVFGNIVQWLQSERPSDISQIKKMSEFPLQHLHLKIYPKETIRVPLGIKTSIPSDMQVNLYARASSAIKTFRLGNCVGVIDSDYPDEWFAAIYNAGSDPIVIRHGQRIVQAVFAPRILTSWPKTETFLISEDRTGGFGSTGDGNYVSAGAALEQSQEIQESLDTRRAADIPAPGSDEPTPTTAAGVAVANMLDVESSPEEEAALDKAIEAEEKQLLASVDQSVDQADVAPKNQKPLGQVLEINLTCGKIHVGPVAKYRPTEHGGMTEDAVVSLLLREFNVLTAKALPLMVQQLRGSHETSVNS